MNVLLLFSKQELRELSLRVSKNNTYFEVIQINILIIIYARK